VDEFIPAEFDFQPTLLVADFDDDLMRDNRFSLEDSTELEHSNLQPPSRLDFKFLKNWGFFHLIDSCTA
jgi:hypothetical protein